MKKLFFSFLLVATALAAYADKNCKTPDTTAQINEQPQLVAGEQQPLIFDERIYDSRIARHGYVEPDSADIVKYGITRPTMPEKNESYRYRNDKPSKMD